MTDAPTARHSEGCAPWCPRDKPYKPLRWRLFRPAYWSQKILEYDLALDNHRATVLITPTCTHEADLRQLVEIPTDLPLRLRQKLEQASSSLTSDIETIADPEEQQRARFATCYLLCTEEFKGEHAFDLALQLRDNHTKPGHERVTFQVPVHIGDAIRWACDPSGGKPAACGGAASKSICRR